MQSPMPASDARCRCQLRGPAACSVPEAVREVTDGRGADAVIDAVGMEAHGAPGAKLAHTLAGLMPDAVARKLMETVGIDQLSALNTAVEIARRGGTVSLSGVYGGTADPLNMLQMFDKQLTLRMGQANLRHWVDDILPLLSGDDDPLRVDTFATHHMPLAEAPQAYEMFQKKEDGAFKIVFRSPDGPALGPDRCPAAYQARPPRPVFRADIERLVREQDDGGA